MFAIAMAIGKAGPALGCLPAPLQLAAGVTALGFAIGAMPAPPCRGGYGGGRGSGSRGPGPSKVDKEAPLQPEELPNATARGVAKVCLRTTAARAAGRGPGPSVAPDCTRPGQSTSATPS